MNRNMNGLKRAKYIHRFTFLFMSKGHRRAWVSALGPRQCSSAMAIKPKKSSFINLLDEPHALDRGASWSGEDFHPPRPTAKERPNEQSGEKTPYTAAQEIRFSLTQKGRAQRELSRSEDRNVTESVAERFVLYPLPLVSGIDRLGIGCFSIHIQCESRCA